VNAAFERFLDQQLPQPGVVACAIRLPDRSILCRLGGDAISKAQVEQVLTRMALAADGLKRHRFATQSLCWTFDRARIHLTHRPDGAMLAVFCENVPGQSVDFGVQRLQMPFHQVAVG
jgi:hypothetical protein